ncbi:MAG: UDP-4-amino-4,6-dideoxy-N-acetyl-beta-L-altrosamine transaminase [Chlamydiales bacterium]|nr:UDP-4-amino-4,6-dideoxy-N-acetyl-beta-L-altrosamine transaminase [Chlamydiia bacterium]MCP5508516.1 UDP-4-amino-4,6-dideoxy-N-acetyl-beta-L-altrosamine transaminase [Chlamydiales bacterium]
MDAFIPYVKHSINEDDIAAVVEAMRSPFITRGPKTEEFEAAVAHYCGARFAVSFNSCTTGLIAAAHAADVSKYDRFLTTPNTFVATVAAGIHCGATPVLVDIDPNTGNIDLAQLKYSAEVQSSRGRNVYAPVHFAGVPVDMEELEQGITDPESIVIEDAAHAIGSEYQDGQKVGCCEWSDMTVFSFHPAKNITTGEGGMVLTNDEALYHRLKRFRNNGVEREPQYLDREPQPWYYEVKEITGNYHLNEMQAALGLSQLKRLDQSKDKRQELLQVYRQRIREIDHVRLLHDKGSDQVMFHLCVALFDFDAIGKTRGEVMEALKERGIGTQVHYIPIYCHPFFMKMAGDVSAYFPNMEAYYRQALSLPLYSQLNEKDIHNIVETIKEVLA